MLATTAVGRLGKDAETRTVKERQVTNFNIAVNRPKKDAEPIWIRCSLWGNPGVVPYLKKGAQVAVTGQLDTNEWTNDAGETKFGLDINVDRLTLVGDKKSDSDDPPPLD
jgi:single-strand DNA-binding protein